MLEKLPTIISIQEHEELHGMPIKEEVQKVVMGLNKNKEGRPDSMIGAFYQDAWEIVRDDVFNMVKPFFCGVGLPRFVTHTNLVLLLKKVIVNNFLNLKPICLSYFVKKIFSNIIH